MPTDGARDFLLFGFQIPVERGERHIRTPVGECTRHRVSHNAHGEAARRRDVRFILAVQQSRIARRRAAAR